MTIQQFTSENTIKINRPNTTISKKLVSLRLVSILLNWLNFEVFDDTREDASG